MIFHFLQYKATDLVVKGPGNFSLTFTPTDGGNTTSVSAFDFTGSGGVILGMYNTDEVCHHLLFSNTFSFKWITTILISSQNQRTLSSKDKRANLACLR